MPFKDVPSADAEALVKTFAEIKTKHTTLNKGTNKLLKAGEIKKLEKEMKEQGGKVNQKMVADLGVARANFEQHAQAIQGAMIECVKLLGIADAAYKRQEKEPTPLHQSQAVDSAQRVIEQINAKIVEARQQDEAYGKSWFKYRGYNPVNAGLDPVYAKEAGDLKSALMNDGKPVTAKIKTMASLVEKAQALADKVQGAAKRGALDLEEGRTKAAKMADDVAKILSAMQNTKGNNVYVLKSSSEAILGQVAAPKPETSRVVRDFITNLVAADKFLRERLKAIELIAANVKPSFDEYDLKDKVVSGHIAALLKSQESAKKEYSDQLPIMKKAIEAGTKFIAGKK